MEIVAAAVFTGPPRPTIRIGRAPQRSSPPYAAMIAHVLASLTGHADNLIEPASALPALDSP